MFTPKLTPDQLAFICQLVKDATIHNPVKQSPARNAFGMRTLEALGDYSFKVDHSSSADIINKKLARGELKLPTVS